MAEPTFTPGGLAVDAAGNPADMPRDLASSINHEMFNVLALLRSALDQIDAIGTESDNDPDGLTGAGSRATSLLLMADERVRAVQRQFVPYV